jgi:HD-GYP domain-containing protein (c-di-GMP phosphodiesterase class II)
VGRQGAPAGLAGEDISAAARCAQIAGTAALFDRLGGPEAAVQAVRRRAGRTLDPDLTAAYLRHARELHEELAAVDPMQVAVEAEPGPQVRVTERQLDDVCRAFGDAVDLKGVSLLGHSAGVAALAEGAGRDLGLARPRWSPCGGRVTWPTSAASRCRPGSGSARVR